MPSSHRSERSHNALVIPESYPQSSRASSVAQSCQSGYTERRRQDLIRGERSRSSSHSQRQRVPGFGSHRIVSTVSEAR